jgi:uncharacterized protein (DUF1697 family)
MITHINLLRAVNVAGNILKMEDLRKLLSELGFADVKTYLQSGNVLFRAVGAPAQLAAMIETRLREATRLPVSVIVRTPAQLQRIIASNPFAEEAAEAPKTVHVTFLAGSVPKAAVAQIGKLRSGRDRWHAEGSEVYLWCPDGYGRTKLSNTALERALGVRATTRNWNTLKVLHAMAIN